MGHKKVLKKDWSHELHGLKVGLVIIFSIFGIIALAQFVGIQLESQKDNLNAFFGVIFVAVVWFLSAAWPFLGVFIALWFVHYFIRYSVLKALEDFEKQKL